MKDSDFELLIASVKEAGRIKRGEMEPARRNQYVSHDVSPPGETLLEVLAERGITQADLAERTGRHRKTIHEIVKGKAAITPETALQLERVLGVPAKFWNNRESQYREFLAKSDERARLLETDAEGRRARALTSSLQE